MHVVGGQKKLNKRKQEGCGDWLGTHVRTVQAAPTLGKHGANFLIHTNTAVIFFYQPRNQPRKQVGLCLHVSYTGWCRVINSLLLHLFHTARTYFLKKEFLKFSQQFASMHVSHSCAYKCDNHKQSTR